MKISDLSLHIRTIVRAALDEDIGSGDLTAQLIPEDSQANATVITREAMVLCGTSWFDECLLTIDPKCEINWLFKDGDIVEPGQVICEIAGGARAMLSTERCALNFIQTLSATATLTKSYVEAVQGADAKIMDTRKTLPGLRIAQKYAVKCGGGHNQRIGLFDGILIKENHIIAAGGIAEALNQALSTAPSDTSIQIEVESLDELRSALDAGAKLVLLDNFSLTDMRIAVEINKGCAELEASGNVNLQTVHDIAKTGVDRISIGGLTKDVNAIDLSMRFES
ncbi:MAG: carboxylating nicotinate-nucleotide diphosphorylase [Gallionella sp.]